MADFNRRVALIGGTSHRSYGDVAHRALYRRSLGPYYLAILPEYWLNEGGQSATGADRPRHPVAPVTGALAQAKPRGTIYEVLNAICAA